jgi:hypothetical protein
MAQKSFGNSKKSQTMEINEDIKPNITTKAQTRSILNALDDTASTTDFVIGFLTVFRVVGAIEMVF